jgi:predicted  nucleic acid-binding Zn-ribbon protein
MSTFYYSGWSVHQYTIAKKGLFLSLLGLSFFRFEASAQVVNKDSLTLVSKINADKEKLAKLQSTVPQAMKEKEETAVQAQESADDNRKAASKLSNDPQNSKLARKADNEASDARSDSRKARKAADRLENLNKDIRNLAERIAKEETKLKKYVVESKAEMTAPSVVIPKDSVH